MSAGLYKENLISAQDITQMDSSEVEDIIPYNLISKEVEILLRNNDDIEFEDRYSDKKPIIPQIENFAKNNSISLPSGWKVELTRKVKIKLAKPKIMIDDEYVQRWTELFGRFIILNKPNFSY